MIYTRFLFLTLARIRCLISETETRLRQHTDSSPGTNLNTDHSSAVNTDSLVVNSSSCSFAQRTEKETDLIVRWVLGTLSMTAWALFHEHTLAAPSSHGAPHLVLQRRAVDMVSGHMSQLQTPLTQSNRKKGNLETCSQMLLPTDESCEDSWRSRQGGDWYSFESRARQASASPVNPQTWVAVVAAP